MNRYNVFDIKLPVIPLGISIHFYNLDKLGQQIFNIYLIYLLSHIHA